MGFLEQIRQEQLDIRRSIHAFQFACKASDIGRCRWVSGDVIALRPFEDFQASCPQILGSAPSRLALLPMRPEPWD